MKRGITVVALATTLSAVLGLALLAVGAAPAVAAPGASLSVTARVSGAARAAESAAPPGLVVPRGLRPQPIGSNVNSDVCQNLSSQPPAPTSPTFPTTTLWAEQALNFTKAWPVTEGAGVTAAVVDSGVDWNSQLAGRLSGIDLTGTGPEDCAGHGTLVAGLIGAADQQKSNGNPFYGVAPAASILSVKVTVGSSSPGSAGTNTLAQGIYDAAFLGAQVISISIQVSDPTPLLADAVQYAISRNAVIVAAGGNDNAPGCNSDPQTCQGPFYPASYPGVLSVGALNTDGTLGDFSDARSNVRVTAPGVEIWSTAPGGYTEDQGTSFATPFVSGVAALIIASHPGISEQAVINRIVDTADGNDGPGTGAGMINPYDAVTALTLPGAPPAAGNPVSVSRALPPDTVARDTAIWVTVGSLGGALLLVIATVVIRQGRRRRWRARPAATPGVASAGPAPPGPGQEPAAVPAGPGSPSALDDDSSDIFSERW
jgi:membrane-anchored mycosin MYCP